VTERVMQTLLGYWKDLLRRIERLEAQESGGTWVILPQVSRLTSTAWDGDARSTTGATLIDMSAVFGTPANIDAVLLSVDARDSGGATADCWVRFSDGTPLSSGSPIATVPPANDRWGRYLLTIPTDSNGDIYFDCGASGTATLDVVVQVHGYHLK
jgi:hypothetical protein